MLHLLGKSHCFVDVGANCGIYSLLGAIVNPRLRVFAIEPAPQTYAALQRNIDVNRMGYRIVAVNCALGDHNAMVPFHCAADATMSSLSIDGYRGQPGTIIQVPCRTLDSLVDEHCLKPDLLKIDVEGFEHAVLLGARKALEAFRPRIVLEANPGDDNERVAGILRDYGYTFYHITPRGLEAHAEMFGVEEYRNWLCEVDRQ
jgi:FkbM family methyltransferase